MFYCQARLQTQGKETRPCANRAWDLCFHSLKHTYQESLLSLDKGRITMATDALRILLIEDDELLADITAFRLELLGFDVAIKGSPEDAFDWLKEKQSDVIILDLALGGGEGLDFLNQLSNDQQFGSIPVLVFSTSADLSSVQKAFAAGANEYLVTPYDPANLEMKLEKLLSLRSPATS